MLCHDAWHLNANCLGGVDSLKALDNPITLADLCSESEWLLKKLMQADIRRVHLGSYGICGT